jgi:hypothetical protein
VLENRVLRELLGPKREEVTKDWTKLDNEGRYDLYWGLVGGNLRDTEHLGRPRN